MSPVATLVEKRTHPLKQIAISFSGIQQFVRWQFKVSLRGSTWFITRAQPCCG